MLPALDDSDLRAEAPIHLGEFQSNITATENDQMLRQCLECDHRSASKIRHVGKVRNIGDMAVADWPKGIVMISLFGERFLPFAADARRQYQRQHGNGQDQQ